MRMTWSRRVLSVLLSAIVLLVILASSQTAASPSFPEAFEGPQAATPEPTLEPPPPIDLSGIVPPEKKGHPKLESALSQVVERFRSDGMAAALRQAEGSGLDVTEELVRVIVVAEAGQAGAVMARLPLLGAKLETHYQDLIQVLAPVSALEALADLGGVRFVRRPIHMFPTAISEAVSFVGASAWHSAGFRGQGIKVAILDNGFQGYQSLLCRDLPCSVVARSFRADGDITGGGEIHGTAVAEIVYDMAPNAQLYLVNDRTEVEFANAVSWLVSQGIRIISQSRGHVSGPFDGTDFEDTMVDWARSNGVLWVNAAGNYGRAHWEGIYVDRDGDGWGEFFGADETNQLFVPSLSVVSVDLTWNSWPYSARDYHLCLFTVYLATVGCSDGWEPQFPQPPRQGLVRILPAGTYYVAIYGGHASQPHHLELYSYNFALRYYVPGSSLGIPATARGALTVGATNFLSDVIEDYSSRGPTNDGRTKPDLSAPARVTTQSYGYRDFAGTSAAAPHVAGAAALVLSAYPWLTPDQVQAYLENRAVDLGVRGKDNVYGAGRVSMGAVPYPVPTPISPQPTPTPFSHQATPTPTATPTSTPIPTPLPLIAAAGGSGSVPLVGWEGSGTFAFGAGKRADNSTDGWLQYTAAGLGTFRATSVGSLVVQGQRAGFWGFGLFDGDGRTYAFNVNVKGSTAGQDRFGIAVWNAVTGTLVHQVEGQLSSGAVTVVGDSR